MLSPYTLYLTAALMALVAAFCTELCVVWSVPAWRGRLHLARGNPAAAAPGAGGLSGMPAAIGGGLISAGIAACALLAWYGVYCALAAI